MHTSAAGNAPDALRAHSDRIAAIVDEHRCEHGRRARPPPHARLRRGLAHRPRRHRGPRVSAHTGGRDTGRRRRQVDSRRRWWASTRRPTSRCFASPTTDALAPLGAVDAASLRAGHVAIVVGRSGEGDAIASAGIVNRVGGAWQTWLGGSIDRLVRLDGGVYDGLSGAPVADASGALVGVATAALSRSYGIVIPASTVTRVVDALLANGRVARPWLGIGAQAVPLADAGVAAADAAQSGLLVTSLAADGPAERAGVRIGDVIVRAAESAAANLRELRQALASHVGRSVTLAVVRGGAPLDLQAQVGEWPGERRCR